jgi:hypothetical protein
MGELNKSRTVQFEIESCCLLRDALSMHAFSSLQMQQPSTRSKAYFDHFHAAIVVVSARNCGSPVVWLTNQLCRTIAMGRYSGVVGNKQEEKHYRKEPHADRRTQRARFWG